MVQNMMCSSMFSASAVYMLDWMELYNVSTTQVATVSSLLVACGCIAGNTVEGWLQIVSFKDFAARLSSYIKGVIKIFTRSLLFLYNLLLEMKVHLYISTLNKYQKYAIYYILNILSIPAHNSLT